MITCGSSRRVEAKTVMREKRTCSVAALLAGLMICLTLFSGCGVGTQNGTSGESNAASAGQSAEEKKPAGAVSAPETEEQAEVLPDVFPQEFVFSSGAGAWRTYLTLQQDGSFTGEYSDSEMGDCGEAYPQGSVYLSTFSGWFKEIRKVDDHTWFLTLGDVSTENETGQEWIEEGIRYVASDPYGLEQGTSFALYTPEPPVAELTEEFLSWWPLRYFPEAERPETLSCYGIYNQEMGYGFFTGE